MFCEKDITLNKFSKIKSPDELHLNFLFLFLMIYKFLLLTGRLRGDIRTNVHQRAQSVNSAGFHPRSAS